MIIDENTTWADAVGFREQAKHALANDVWVAHSVMRIRTSIEAAIRGSYPRDEAYIDVAQVLMTYAETVKRYKGET